MQLDELLNQNNGWIQNNNSLLFSIKVKIEDLTDYSKQTFKTIDYTLNQYSIIDTFTITNIRNNIVHRISSSYQFGKDNDIVFNFEGISNPEKKIQLDIVFAKLNLSGTFGIYILFRNRNINNSKMIYENILFDPANLRHSFVFDITESDFNESNGWIYQGIAQFQFKVANFEFSDFPEKANFPFQSSFGQNDQMGYYNHMKPNIFNIFGLNNRKGLFSRFHSNLPNNNLPTHPLHLNRDNSDIMGLNNDNDNFLHQPFFDKDNEDDKNKNSVLPDLGPNFQSSNNISFNNDFNFNNLSDDIRFPHNHTINNEFPDFTSHFHSKNDLTQISDFNINQLQENPHFNEYDNINIINNTDIDENEIGLAGLQNQGATCYLNSAIQLLFHIPSFRKIVYQIKVDENSSEKSDKITLSLQKLFISMQVNSKSVCSTSDLTKSFGWSQRELITEHDVQEFIRTLIDNLEKKIKGTNLDGEIAKIFRGKFCTVVRAPQVKYESVKNEFFYDLPLDVRGSANLEESLKNFLKPEELTGNNMYNVEGVGPQEAEMHTEFIEFPSVLQIHLKRFEYDLQNKMECKINDRFEFPPSIDLSNFIKNENKSSENIYDLYCVLVHEGFAYLGHYYAFIRQILSHEKEEAKNETEKGNEVKNAKAKEENEKEEEEVKKENEVENEKGGEKDKEEEKVKEENDKEKEEVKKENEVESEKEEVKKANEVESENDGEKAKKENEKDKEEEKVKEENEAENENDKEKEEVKKANEVDSEKEEVKKENDSEKVKEEIGKNKEVKNWKFNDDLNCWFKFNDSFVSKSSFSEAVVNNYGGSFVSSPTNEHLIQGDKFFSAYMIVYVRRNEVVDLMKPVSDDEIPPHLRDFTKQLKENKTNFNETQNEVCFGRPRIIDNWDQFGRINYEEQVETMEDASFMLEDSFFANFTKDFCEMNLKEKKISIKLSSRSSLEDIYKAAEKALNVEKDTIRLWITTGDFKPYKPLYKNESGILPGNFFVQMKDKNEPLKFVNPFKITTFVIFFDISLELPGQYIGSTLVKKNDPISAVFKFANEKLGFPENNGFLTYKEKGGPYPFTLVDEDYQLKEKASFVVLQLKKNITLTSLNCNYRWKTNADFNNVLSPIEPNKMKDELPFYNFIQENRNKLSEASSYFLAIKRYFYLIVYMIKQPDVPLIRIKYSTAFTIPELTDFIVQKLKINYNRNEDSILLFTNYDNSTNINNNFLTTFKDISIKKEYNFYVQEIKGMNFETIQKAKPVQALIAFDGYNVSLQTRVYIENDTQAASVISYLIEEKILKDSLINTEYTENEEEDNDDDDMIKAMTWLEEGKIRIYKVDNHTISNIWELDDIIPNNTYEIKIDIVPDNHHHLTQSQILITGSHKHKIKNIMFPCLNPFFFVIDTEERVCELKERLKNTIHIDGSWDNCSIYLGDVELCGSMDTSKIKYIDKSNYNLIIYHKTIN